MVLAYAPPTARLDLAALFRTERAGLFAVALRITRQPASAEDVVQSAFLRAWRARDTFRGDAQPRTWLHRIVVNEALCWRRAERRRELRIPTAGDATPLEAVFRGPSQEDHLAARELERRVAAALPALRPVERDALRGLADAEGDLQRYAAAAGLPITTAKTRVCRARARLRAVI
jgi:RNA polymerase sigma-70 factor (ECF subfamily)